MDIEELEPRKKSVAPLDLDKLSIEELADYIVSLEREIARVQAKMAAKNAHLAGAASLFKNS